MVLLEVLGIDLFLYLSLIIAGFFIGIVASMVGIGGGLLTVPMLMYLYGFPNNVSSAISSAVIIGTSSSGAYSYFKQHRIDLRTGVYFVLIAIPSSFLGGILADTLANDLLTGLFGIMMILISIRKILFDKKKEPESEFLDDPLHASKTGIGQSNYKNYGIIPQSIEERHIIDDEGEEFHYHVNLRKTLLGALFGGIIGGMLGVGGGIIFVPVLTSIGGVPPHLAVATSTFTILFASTSATASRIIGGKILWDYVIALMLGTVFGARLGALKVKKIKSRNVLIMFYIIVIITGIRTILQAAGLM